MAKKINLNFIIRKAADLVTPREKTRSGFISLALEKNYLAVPYIEEAKTLKALANKAKKPQDLLHIQELRIGLLTASDCQINR
jgi:type II restriction enzyme